MTGSDPLKAAVKPVSAGHASHPEQQYLDLLARVWREGSERRDRTGVGTRALFGATMRFDLSDGTVPLLTTKRVFWKSAAKELLWFLSGNTNIRPLVEQGVHIWTDWPLDRYRRETGDEIGRDAFEARIVADDDFAEQWGDLGPVYGAQWVGWPSYEPVGGDGPDRLYREGKPINQIAELVEGLKRNPASRRHIFTGWNVAKLGTMALPPCHMTYQYFVEPIEGGGGRLSGILYQRSCDLGLGFGFNIFEHALLIRMLADQCGYVPGEAIWMGADCHVYLNHEHLVAEQIARAPRAFPTLVMKRTAPSIFDYQLSDFDLIGYDPHPHIAAPVAV
ncbi:thymidylate synthase [Sphingomonas oleivorans]|uniref:Thymidylate synthase n=1 Tax=Sphingomonas oleivorans TaxID=1735121 RepID=A0A2T5FZY6_9SPHN|nr:thymidylate synthase [Sphingomonas oleivorans]PTQ12273.1 thymidylate synthase [Sphingomonas oleivorans]